MSRRQIAAYCVTLTACLLVSIAAGWTTLGVQFDNDIYDFLFRITPPEPRTPSSVILGVDEETLRNTQGGPRRLRRILAEGIERLASAKPTAVAVDVILADPPDPSDAADDTALAAAFAKTRNLVLAADLTAQGWEEPIPEFGKAAAAIGHAHADPDIYDNVVRQIPLEKAAGRKRFFALALEAFRLARPGTNIVETPEALEIGTARIAGKRQDSRPLLIRYMPAQTIPLITFHQLKTDPSSVSKASGKTVFIGMIAQSAAQDRHMTPSSYGQPMPGVEIQANAFETLAHGEFLEPAANSAVVLFCVVLAAAAGAIFWRVPGWPAYSFAGVLLMAVHAAPYAAFRSNVVFPYAAPLATAWLTVSAAASFQHFIVRRRMRKAEIEREGYRKAIHFVAHEMRTPLTAIQGSSELMGRYKLSEEKRNEIAQMINSESRRLARMIQTFLDVERLTAGHMEIKREPFDAAALIEVCLERAQPLADRKRIRLHSGRIEEIVVHGDRELMEYAIYNLITNAIKYSNSGTEVGVTARLDGDQLRLSVRDQGIGMDETELGNIFKKFYRTKRAELSGETGTGIGLSLVEQIVSQHSGKMEVSSKPGAGSCFTVLVPATSPVSRKTD